MTHDELKTEHYRRLNDYQNTKEYREYATYRTDLKPADNLPSLFERWEIDEEIYWHFLEILPPLAWKDGVFYMSEFLFSNITSKYSKIGDKYYHERARFTREIADTMDEKWGRS